MRDILLRLRTDAGRFILAVLIQEREAAASEIEQLREQLQRRSPAWATRENESTSGDRSLPRSENGDARPPTTNVVTSIRRPQPHRCLALNNSQLDLERVLPQPGKDFAAQRALAS